MNKNYSFCLYCDFFASTEVPDIPFTFLKDPRKDNVEGFVKLEPNSDIWVEISKLERVMSDSSNIKIYGKKLMWTAIMDDENVKLVLQSRVYKVGFVKMIGEKNFQSIYGKVTFIS